MIKVSRDGGADVARDCARLRQRVFMETYGPLGLTAWPGDPDHFDLGGELFTARQDGALVGTALLHHERYDGQPFWHDRFGLQVTDLIAAPQGQRIAELGRVAIDKAAVDKPLEVASQLATKVSRAIVNAGIGPVIAVTLSPAMLAFYQDLVGRLGGSLALDPRAVPYQGVEIRYMVLRLPEEALI